MVVRPRVTGTTLRLKAARQAMRVAILGGSGVVCCGGSCLVVVKLVMRREDVVKDRSVVRFCVTFMDRWWL